MKLYKFLNSNGEAPFTRFAYPVGEWLPPIKGALKMCESGYHACRQQDLLHWINAQLYVCDWRGDILEADDKVAVSELKLVRRVESWNEKNQRLFACDCAERALHLYEQAHPGDKRPRNVIETVRRYANGEATETELQAARAAAQAADAASATVDAAADAAAAAAASATADAAQTAYAAWAARAARAAVDAEYNWQMKRLLHYIGGEL